MQVADVASAVSAAPQHGSRVRTNGPSSRRHSSSEPALQQLKREKDAMYEKLVGATAEAADSYSARLDAEMAKWQQQAQQRHQR